MTHSPDNRPLTGRLVRLGPTRPADKAELVGVPGDPRVFAPGFTGGVGNRAATIVRLIAMTGEDRTMYTIRLAGDIRLGPVDKVAGTMSPGNLGPRAQHAHAG